MYSVKKVSCIAGMLVWAFTFFQTSEARTKSRISPDNTLSIIEKVNDHWQAHHSPETRAFWDEAVYFSGNMEAYRLTGKSRYLEYADRWARHNHWQGATEKNPGKWQYKTYGEGQDFVLFGDWQACFQTYLDLYANAPSPHKIARVMEVMDYECASLATDYWWWSDALYMAMPVMTKLYKVTGDKRYLDKLYDNFLFADSLMFDAESGLYFRDARYIYPSHRTSRGKKDFWSRGNGWVLAGLAKVLSDMPVSYPHRAFFEQRFRQLAEGVARCQHTKGYWTRSLLDSKQAEGPETSGTAFFAYGLLWGMNQGLLDQSVYQSVTDRAWNYLANVALQPDGSVGFVQPVGEKAVKGQRLTARDVTNFGTGAFLLAACEKVRFDDGSVLKPRHDAKASPSAEKEKGLSFVVSNPRDVFADEVVALDGHTVFQRLGISGGRQMRITDISGTEIPYQLAYDGKILVSVHLMPHGRASFSIKKGLPQDYLSVCYGRRYPERVDDLAWENDRSAYRCYGPALQRTGEKSYGNDVWVKNTPSLVVENRYAMEKGAQGEIARLSRTNRAAAVELSRRTSYHIDHGNGLDCYKVGPTLGCGAPALMIGDSLAYPYCYSACEILDNGPLRFTARLTYPPRTVDKDTAVVEERLISLDKGSNLCRMTVSYSGLSAPVSFASGVVIHREDTLSVSLGRNYVLYADPTDNPSLHQAPIYVATLFPYGKVGIGKKMFPRILSGASGHALGIVEKYQGEPFTYYFGSAWSLYDCRSMQEWELRVRAFDAALKAPLQVELR